MQAVPNCVKRLPGEEYILQKQTERWECLAKNAHLDRRLEKNSSSMVELLNDQFQRQTWRTKIGISGKSEQRRSKKRKSTLMLSRETNFNGECATKL